MDLLILNSKKLILGFIAGFALYLAPSAGLAGSTSSAKVSLVSVLVSLVKNQAPVKAAPKNICQKADLDESEDGLSSLSQSEKREIETYYRMLNNVNNYDLYRRYESCRHNYYARYFHRHYTPVSHNNDDDDAATDPDDEATNTKDNNDFGKYGLLARIYTVGADKYYESVEDYLEQGSLVENTVLLVKRLFFPYRTFKNGFFWRNGIEIKDKLGKPIKGGFALEMISDLTLKSWQNPGLYQLAVISQQPVIISHRANDGGAGEAIVNNDGRHGLRMVCSLQPIQLSRGQEVPVHIAYAHNSKDPMSMVVMWRPWNPKLAESECGKWGQNRYFEIRNRKIRMLAPYMGLLAKGWRSLSLKNFEIPENATKYCNNTGGEEPPPPPPPPPAPTPQISNVRAVNVGVQSAQIQWNTDIDASSQVEYINLSSGQVTTSAMDVNLVKDHMLALSNLASNTSYSVVAISVSGAGKVARSDAISFTTLIPAPQISNFSVSQISTQSAVFTWTTDYPASSQILLRTAGGQIFASQTDPQLALNHSVVVTGLAPSTAYAASAVSVSGSGLQTTSSEINFATLVPAPGISNIQVINITTNSATITWDTDLPSTSQVQYFDVAAGMSYQTIVDSNMTTAHSVQLSNLGADALYYSVTISSSASGLSTTSEQVSFRTLVPAPDIMNFGVSMVSTNSAVADWNTMPASTSQVEIKNLLTNEVTSTPLVTDLTQAHHVLLSGLQADTPYEAVALGSSASGLSSRSASVQFRTLVPAPAISGVQVTNIGLNSATVVWSTDLPATSKVQVFNGSNALVFTSSDMNLSTSHSANITGLNSNTNYSINITSASASGLETVVLGVVFTTNTPPPPPPAPAPVISNIQVINITNNSAVIIWNTDIPATSQVSYTNVSSGVKNTTALDSNLVTSHSVTITGLSANTLYSSITISSSSQGQTSVGAELSFRTRR